MQQLPEDIKELQELVRQMLKRIEALETENHLLREENKALKRQLTRHSSNSHQPPSQDHYQSKRKKTIKPALAKDKKAKGGQVGHQGKTLEPLASKDVDKTIIHSPEQCSCCGRTFLEGDAKRIVGRRQVFDLPAQQLEVVEHQVAEIHCCGLKNQGVYPEEVRASVQYGSGVRTLVSLMSVEYRLPLEKISGYFRDIYGYEINSSTILSSLSWGYEHLGATEASIKAKIQTSSCVHFDETSLKCDKQRYWLHSASTASYTHLFVHEKRGGEALKADDSVIKDFNGIAVHDCWRPYFHFGCTHALCGAHLLRELTGLIESGSAWARKMHAYLMKLYQQARPLNKAQQQLSLVNYRSILRRADREEPAAVQGKRGRPKLSVGRALLKRLVDYQDAVHAFAFIEGVPFTNNQAERDIRPLKVKQKVAGCFRTLAGAKHYVRFQAVISTLKKQGINVFASLRCIF